MSTPGEAWRATLAGGARTATGWRLRGGAPAIVLVHSAGGGARSFDSMLPFLAGREVVVPAFPGREGSDGPHPGTAEAAAVWLREVLAALELSPCVVAGHSVGGAIAMELALTAPSELTGLALLATGARLRVRPDLLRALEEACARRTAADLSTWLPEDPARAATPPETVLADWRLADAFDRMEAIASIRVPTTIFSGTSDPLTPPKYAHFLRDRIPGATLHSLEGAGHELPRERPAEIAAALVRLCARHLK